jgi:hypothetical protein
MNLVNYQIPQLDETKKCPVANADASYPVTRILSLQLSSVPGPELLK